MIKNFSLKLTQAGATGLAAGLVILGLAGVGAMTSPVSENDVVSKKRLIPVDVIRMQSSPFYAVRREFAGRVEARRESRVGFELGGKVASVLVNDGEFVEEGQVLAVLVTELLEARRAELVALRNQARAELELAAITRQRVREAHALNAVSSQAWDEAEKHYLAKKAALAQAESAVQSIDVQIRKSALVAPFDALIAERFVDEGQVISTGQRVLHLLERANPEVRIGVAGDAVDRIAPGQRHELIIRGRRIPATIRSVLPVRDRRTRSIDVVFTLHTEFNGIRQGDLARFELERPVDEPGFWLPLTALTESSRGLWAVYAVKGGDKETGTLERRDLELLHQEADRVFVRGTLAEGERIVVGGLHRLVPGQAVRIASIDKTLTAMTEGK